MSTPTPQQSLDAAVEHWHERFGDNGADPLLYVPADGQSDGYVDVVAVDHGDDSAIKITIDPEGSISSHPLRAPQP